MEWRRTGKGSVHAVDTFSQQSRLCLPLLHSASLSITRMTLREATRKGTRLEDAWPGGRLSSCVDAHCGRPDATPVNTIRNRFRPHHSALITPHHLALKRRFVALVGYKRFCSPPRFTCPTRRERFDTKVKVISTQSKNRSVVPPTTDTISYTSSIEQIHFFNRYDASDEDQIKDRSRRHGCLEQHTLVERQKHQAKSQRDLSSVYHPNIY